MAPTENVFKLKAPCIANKIRLFAKKAGISGFHTHSMRHKFACDLLERGANLKQVQELLGHENLATTEVYLSLTSNALREAVSLLDDSGRQKGQREGHYSMAIFSHALQLPAALPDDWSKLVVPYSDD